MMIEQTLAEVVKKHQEEEAAIAEDDFTVTLADACYQNVACLLYPKYILIYFKKNKTEMLRINFGFDLIFSVIREEAEGKKMGKALGIAFERFEQGLTLKSEESDRTLAWRDVLGVKLNQRGFHELFRPIKKIGKGNFATVYLVHKNENAQKYAVKAFSKEAAYSEENGKESLINQIEIMRRFQHRNLMRLQEIYESENSIYINVQLLEGGQLYDKIKSKHKFSPKETKTVMKGILEGLEVMHARDIMHRDLKPENILFRKDGDFDCVIADFGLAQNCKEDYMFVRCGTPGYVAPEVVNLKNLKAKYDPICDLFSVGVIFHLISMRRPPFPGKEYDQVLAQNRKCSINFEHNMYQTIPLTWLNLMKRLLEKDPSKRITATEALNHEFFAKDDLFKQFTENRRSNTMSSQECSSPLMMTKNTERKRKMMLRDDSCLKFKMKENVLTGRTDESGEMVDQINSPVAIKSKVVKINESRFKRAQCEE